MASLAAATVSKMLLPKYCDAATFGHVCRAMMAATWR